MNRFQINRKKLFNDMVPGDMAVFFAGMAPVSTADSLYPFRTDKNFYYLTGLKREGFMLVMSKDESQTHETLFVAEPNYDIEKWLGRALSKESWTEISGVEDVQYIEGFDKMMNTLIYKDFYSTIYIDLAKVHHDREGLYAHNYAKRIQDKYPQMAIKNVHHYLRGYRLYKSEEEVGDMQKAIDLTKNGLEHVMRVLKPGDYEYVPSSAFNFTIMSGGADGNSFETIAASGENATILHYIENDHVMADGTLVLMDLGAQYKEYAADITRTYPVNGRFTDRQKVLYNLVLKAHDAVIERMKPGVEFSELNKTCSAVLTAGLLKLGLINNEEELGNYYYHGVSHFLGLDTHDLGNREAVLAPGMVLTVEPGLYSTDEAIGIRIEDDVLITEEGNEVLSSEIIRTVEEIESFMNR